MPVDLKRAKKRRANMTSLDNPKNVQQTGMPLPIAQEKMIAFETSDNAMFEMRGELLLWLIYLMLVAFQRVPFRRASA